MSIIYIYQISVLTYYLKVVGSNPTPATNKVSQLSVLQEQLRPEERAFVRSGANTKCSLNYRPNAALLPLK